MAAQNDTVAIINVATTNGSIFNGTFSFASPHFDGGGIVNIQGNHVNGFTLNLTRDLTESDVGEHHVTITATQDGFSITSPFTFVVLDSGIFSKEVWTLRPLIKYIDTNTFYSITISQLSIGVISPIDRYVNHAVFYRPVVDINQVNPPIFWDRKRIFNKSRYKYLGDMHGTPIATVPPPEIPLSYPNYVMARKRFIQRHNDFSVSAPISTMEALPPPNDTVRTKRFIQRHKDFSVNAPVPEIPLPPSNEVIRRKRFTQRHKNESVNASIPLSIFTSLYVEMRGRTAPLRRNVSVSTPTVLLGLTPLQPVIFVNTNTFYTPTVSGSFVTVSRTPIRLRRPSFPRTGIYVHSNASVGTPTALLGLTPLQPTKFDNTNIFYSSPNLAGAGTDLTATRAPIRLRRKRFIQPRHKNESVKGTTTINQFLNPSLYTDSDTFFIPNIITDLPPPNVEFDVIFNKRRLGKRRRYTHSRSFG